MLENSAVFKHVDFFIGESVLLSQNSREVYFNQFIDASLQRIMQACGAYCFLSQVKNKVAFKHHILPGAQRLMELLQLCEIISNGLCEISLKTELST
jgi:hypothetical protein